MDITSVFDWFARDSLDKVEKADDPRQREMFLKLAELWADAAQQSRDGAPTQSTLPTTVSSAHSGGRAE
jgi:hypothetical protein